MNQVVHGKGQRNERLSYKQGRGWPSTMIPSDFIVKQLLIYYDYTAFSVPDKLPSFFRRYKQPVSF